MSSFPDIGFNTRSAILFRHRVAERVVGSSPADLDRLPPIERSILFRVLSGEKTTSIAPKLGLSQPSISYRLYKATSRLEILASYPHLTDSEVRRGIEASGYESPTASLEDLTLMVSTLLKTSCQSAAGRATGRSQGWARHQLAKFRMHMQAMKIFWGGPVTSEDDPVWASLLHALEVQEKHGHFLPLANTSSLPKRVQAPSGAVVHRAATEALMVQVPAQSAARKQQAPVSDEEVGLVVDLLRRHGPQLRSAILEVLNDEGHAGSRILWHAAHRKAVFRRQGTRRGGSAPMRLLLLPQAATSLKQSFEIDWHGAIREFCAVYDAFLTSAAMRHLGLFEWHRAYHDNVSLVKRLIQGQGFEELQPDEWGRRKPAKRTPSSCSVRESLRTQILKIVREGGLLQRREIEERVSGTQSQVTDTLRALVKCGGIVRTGRGRASAYMCSRRT